MQLLMAEVVGKDLERQVVTLQSPQLHLCRVDINTPQSDYHMTMKVRPHTCQANLLVKEVEQPRITSVLTECQISSRTK